jgi:hypothetical protein
LLCGKEESTLRTKGGIVRVGIGEDMAMVVVVTERPMSTEKAAHKAPKSRSSSLVTNWKRSLL